LYGAHATNLPFVLRLTRAYCERRARDLSSDLNYQDTGPLKPSPSTLNNSITIKKQFHFALCRPVTHARPECGGLSRGEPCIQARLFTSACCLTPASSRQMHEVPSFTARMPCLHTVVWGMFFHSLLTMCGCLESPTLRHAARHAPPPLSRARGPHHLKFTKALVLDHPNVRWCRGGLRDPPTTLSDPSEVTPARTPSRGPPIFNFNHACF
jgi:hypothetical protein